MVTEDEAVDWVALRCGSGLGDAAGRRLLEHFGTAPAALAAAPAAVAAAPLGSKLAQGLAAAAAYRESARREVARTREHGARIVPFTAAEYPDLLRHVVDAPLYLVALGEPLVTGPALAVVGARHASAYGRDVAARLAEDLALAGVMVVSGLARGVDGAAHAGALRAGGRTIAVLGSGIDVVYPPEHHELAQEIARAGTLLSELPLGATPHPSHFPRRNRIIAGMTHGTVVVEAASGSGSLITARLALELGREVFAVPGRIDSSLSAGPHRLIQQGAKLVMGIGDLISEIGPALRPRTGPAACAAPMGPEASPILALLRAGPMAVDQLIRTTGLAPAELLCQLLDLELRGLVVQRAGRSIELAR